MIQNAQGQLLVFAEKRDNDSSSDFGNFNIVMRKSTDGGRTWGALKTVADDGENRVSNPVPVLDPGTGDVLLISCIRNANSTYKGLFLQRSTNGGDTFSPLSAGQIKPRGFWKGGLTGPGHGVVLSQGSHAGRIVVAMGYRKADYHGAYGIYSDDGGVSWSTGYDQADKSGKTAIMEGTIAELPTGRLYIGYRDGSSTTPGKTRLSAFSMDGGASLSTTLAPQPTLRTPSVEGSVVSLSGTHSGTMLFSSPTYVNEEHLGLRRYMGIFLSGDDGVTWRRPYHVDLGPKPAAYSDLIQLDDGSVGIIYETGKSSWRERITFRSIRIGQLVNPTKVAAGLEATLRSRTVTTAGHAKVKVAVSLAGVTSPPGSVSVRFTGPSRKARVRTVTLTYFSGGVRYVSLPKLKKGRYAISVRYSGTDRIIGRVMSLGTLRVRKS